MDISRTITFKDGWEEQIIKDLDEVEKRSRARLIDRENVKKVFEIIKKTDKGHASLDGGYVPKSYRYYKGVKTTYFTIQWQTINAIDEKSIRYSIRRDSADHVPYGASPSCSISVYINSAYRHIIYPKNKDTEFWIDNRHKWNIRKLEKAGLLEVKIPNNHFITEVLLDKKSLPIALIELYTEVEDFFYFENLALVTPNYIFPLPLTYNEVKDFRTPRKVYEIITGKKINPKAPINKIEKELIISSLG